MSQLPPPPPPPTTMALRRHGELLMTLRSKGVRQRHADGLAGEAQEEEEEDDDDKEEEEEEDGYEYEWV